VLSVCFVAKENKSRKFSLVTYQNWKLAQNSLLKAHKEGSSQAVRCFCNEFIPSCSIGIVTMKLLDVFSTMQARNKLSPEIDTRHLEQRKLSILSLTDSSQFKYSHPVLCRHHEPCLSR
jgi:hypothetical protein